MAPAGRAGDSSVSQPWFSVVKGASQEGRQWRARRGSKNAAASDHLKFSVKDPSLSLIFFSFSHFPFSLPSLLGPNRTTAPEVQAAERGPAHHPVRCTAGRSGSHFLPVISSPQVRVALGRLTPRPVPVSEANLTYEFFLGFSKTSCGGRKGPILFLTETCRGSQGGEGDSASATRPCPMAFCSV